MNARAHSVPAEQKDPEEAGLEEEREHTFGRERCLNPFYALRIHANGDVVYCWGFRDPVVGNVHDTTLAEACASPMADRLRRHCLQGRLPVCSRCCGLFLT